MLKIYRIVDNTNGNIYIGKTTQTLKARLYGHKHKNTCSSHNIIKNGDYRIELIEETDDDTRERYWIQNTDCINIRKLDYDKIKQNKKYYENNKEKISQKHKKYIEYNFESIQKYKKNRDIYINSMGGDPRYNNNLLKIDPNLFF